MHLNTIHVLSSNYVLFSYFSLKNDKQNSVSMKKSQSIKHHTSSNFHWGIFDIVWQHKSFLTQIYVDRQQQQTGPIEQIKAEAEAISSYINGFSYLFPASFEINIVDWELLMYEQTHTHTHRRFFFSYLQCAEFSDLLVDETSRPDFRCPKCAVLCVCVFSPLYKTSIMHKKKFQHKWKNKNHDGK